MNHLSSSGALSIVAALVVSASVNAPTYAQTPPSPTTVEVASQSSAPITLSDLVAELDRRNPGIAAARHSVDASVAAIRPAGALPDPTLSAGYMNDSAIPFGPLNSDLNFRQFGMSQELPYPGKLSLRTKIATSESEAQRWSYETTRRQMVAELKAAYYQYVFVDRSLAALARNKTRLDEFRRIAEVRYSVGKAMQQDVLKAQLEISLLIERQAMLTQQRTALRAQINGLLARSIDRPLDVSLPDTSEPMLPALEEIQALAAQNNPELKQNERMVDRSEQALALAKRERLPDFGVAVAAQQNGGGMPWMYGVNFVVKVPLYSSRKQQPLIAQAVAQLSAERMIRESTLTQTAARIADVYAMAETSRRLLSLYGDSVMPQARLALESSLASYQVGGVDFLTVLTNFVTLLNYEINYEEQNARFREALARLEPLVGIALTN